MTKTNVRLVFSSAAISFGCFTLSDVEALFGCMEEEEEEEEEEEGGGGGGEDCFL